MHESGGLAGEALSRYLDAIDLARKLRSYAAAKRGEIPTIKLGKLFRVPVRALEAMLDSALPPLAQV